MIPFGEKKKFEEIIYDIDGLDRDGFNKELFAMEGIDKHASNRKKKGLMIKEKLNKHREKILEKLLRERQIQKPLRKIEKLCFLGTK